MSAIEKHVVSTGFGMYAVYEGVFLNDKPLTRCEAEELAASENLPLTRIKHQIERLERERAGLTKERQRLKALIAENDASGTFVKRWRASVDELKGTIQMIKKQIAVAQADAAVLEMIDELDALTKRCDEDGATMKDAARVERILAELRFAGIVRHPAETTRVQIARLMQMPVSPADRRLKWSMFAGWAKRPAPAAA